MGYQKKEILFMPISLNITDREILIIGGGEVAMQKIELIMRFTRNIRIVASNVSDKIKALRLQFIEKSYEQSDLKDAFLVYACTDSVEINQQVLNDARHARILANIVDNPVMTDFVSPAVYKKDHMTVSVGSNGQDVMASIRWRNVIQQFLETNPID